MDDIHKNQKTKDYQMVLKAYKYLQAWIVLEYNKNLVIEEIGDEKQMENHINKLKTKLEDFFRYFYSNSTLIIDNEIKLNRKDDLKSNEWKFHQNYLEFLDEYEFPKAEATINEPNKSHYTVVVVELPQETNVLLGVWQSKKDWNTYFCATMSSTNDDSTNSSNVVLSNRITVGDHVDWLSFSCSKEFASKNKFKFEVFSLYNKVSLDASGMLNIIVPNEQEKDNDKAISVYQLAVDLLFVNALIFVYVVEKMTRQEKKTIEDDNFKDDSDHLIDTFHKMQGYLKEKIIFNDLIKEKDVFFYMYEDYKINLDLPNEVNWKSKIPCREQFKNALIKPTLKEYLFELLPVIYFLKQAQVSSFENDEPIWFDLLSSYLKYELVNAQNREALFQKVIWNYKNKINDNLKYDQGCKEQLNKLEEKNRYIENILPYKGFYEKSVKRIYDESQKVIDYEKYNLKEEFLRSMVWNFEIRKTLCENCLIGVIGLSKAGKSSFVKMFTGKDIASPIDETKEMSAYRISDKVNLLLIDYPRINSNLPFYALQFTKSKFMLDYVFVVIDVIQFGDTMTLEIANMLEKLKGLSVRRFCIIANKFDKFNEEILKDRKAFVEEKNNKIMTQVSDCLQKFEENKKLVFNNDVYTKDLLIIPACINSRGVLKQNVELIEEAGVLLDIKLKIEILELLRLKIHDRDVVEQIEELKKEYEEDAKKEVGKTCNFKYEIKKKAQLKFLVYITNDDTIEEDEKHVKSLGKLMEILIEVFSLGENSFKIKTIEPNSNNQIIEQFEDFFNTKCQDFEIFLIN